MIKIFLKLGILNLKASAADLFHMTTKMPPFVHVENIGRGSYIKMFSGSDYLVTTLYQKKGK